VSCHACGADVPGTARFCGRCGAARHGRSVSTAPDVGPGTTRRRRRAPALAAAAVLGAVAAGGFLTDVGTSGGHDDAVEVDPAEAAGVGPTPAAPGPDRALRPVGADRFGIPMDCRRADREPPGSCPAWLLAVDDPAPPRVAAAGEALIVATDHLVRRLDPRDATAVWDWQPPDGRRVRSVTTSEDLVLVTLAGGGGVQALSAEIGQRLWNARGELPLAVTGAGPVVVVVEPSQVVVRSTTTGEVVTTIARRADDPAGVVADPTRNQLVGVTGGRLRSWPLDTVTARGWSVATTTTQAPVVVGGLVVTLDDDRTVVAHDAASGRVRWERTVAGARGLVPVGDDRVGVTTGDDLVLLSAGDGRTDDTVLVGGGGLEQVAVGADGRLYAVTGLSVARLDPSTGGPTWTLGLANAGRVAGPVAVTADGRHLAVPLVGSDTAAVALFRPGDAALAVTPVCTGARPSTAMGATLGWRGDRAHVRIELAGAGSAQVLLGIPNWPADGSRGSVVVSARLADGGDAVAGFGAVGDEPVPTYAITDGARSSSGWPTHWSLAGHLPAAGCWELTVATDAWTDTVVVPIGPPSDGP
jgi:outer membrane protein assembly factor BamB